MPRWVSLAVPGNNLPNSNIQCVANYHAIRVETPISNFTTCGVDLACSLPK